MGRHPGWKLVPAVLLGLAALGCGPEGRAQQPPSRQEAGQPVRVSDEELRAFARAYTEFHTIRERYEASLESARDPAERDRIQREGNAKVKEAVERQGLSVERYNRIFEAVNASEDLRQKALRLIDAERKKS